MSKIEKKNFKHLYSFDVFDTLITRTFATPEGIFLAIQENLKKYDKFNFLPDFLKNNFYNIRTETQLFCRANQYVINKKNDCSLDDIYETIKNNFGLNNSEKEILKNYEIETEFSNIIPINENINKAKKLINSGEKVILISDMYFSAEIIRKLLIKCDDVFKDIEIYTSGDIGKLKSDGTLYKFIKEKYPNVKWTHYGDNKISDGFAARLNGIKTQKYNIEKFKPYEKFLIEDKKSVYNYLSVGISKFVRTLNKNSQTYTLGCSFAGPILYGYVNWFLEQSMTRGIKHLYFVARDGYVLKEIADIIIEQRNYEIKTHYFYSSRIANRIPDEKNIDKFIINLCDELKNLISFEFLAERLHININELKNFFDIKNPDKHLTEKDITEFANKAISNEEFKKFVIEKNRPRKDLFIRYIKQEIDLSKNDFAFVELNGTGRTQDNIVNLININFDVISFFLINTSGMKQNDLSKKIFYSYSGDFFAEYLELFCRTEHGQTIGYEEKDSKIVPVLEIKKNEQIKNWGYGDYLDGLKMYTTLFCKYCCINNILVADLNLFVKIFDYYKFHLDAETRKVLCNIPYLIYGNETKGKSLLVFNIWNIFKSNYLLKTFFTTHFYIIIKKTLLLCLIFLNIFKIKPNTLYKNYYKYFLK